MAKKVKIPKQVAGVKVPKKLRKKAKKAVKMADNPAVREMAVAALGAAALKIAEKIEAGQAAKSAGNKAKREAVAVSGKAGDAAADLRREAAKLGDAIRAAALEGARRLLEEIEQGKRGKGAKTGSSAPE